MPLNIDTRTPSTITLAGPDNGAITSNTRYVLPELALGGTLLCTPDSTGVIGQLSWKTNAVAIPDPSSNSQLVTDANDVVSWQPRGQNIPSLTQLTFNGILTNNGTLNMVNSNTGNSGFTITQSSSNNVVTVDLAGGIAAPTDSTYSQSGGSFRGTFTIMEISSQQTFSQRWSCFGVISQTNTSLLQNNLPITVGLANGSNPLDCKVTIQMNIQGSQACSAFAAANIATSVPSTIA